MPEPRFERELAAVGMCVWRWDSIADTAICSDACADLFGLPHGTRLTYDELLSVVHPDDRGPVKAAVQRALAGDGEYEVEYRVLWRDGTEHWIAAKGRAELDSSNTPLLMEGVAQDITERKRGEVALRASEERFRTLAEAAPIAIFLTRATGECTYVNATWTAISELSLQASLGYGWMRVVHPDDRARLEETWPVAAACAAKCEIDYRIITPTGMLRWLHALVTPQFDGAGSLVGYVGSVEDITERKRAEETVREWRDRYEAVIRASGQVLYDWDARTDHVVYGGNFEQTLGYDPAEMAGGIARWLSIVHPEDLAKFDAELQRSLRTETTFHLEYRVRRRDGRYLVVRDDGHLIHNAASEVVRVVGLVEDITERKRAETLLAGQKRMLEMIALGAPLRDTLDAVLRLAESLTPGMLASIMLCEPNRTELRPVAAPSLSAEYLAAIDCVPIAPHAGSCGAAAFWRERVVVTDIATDPLWTEYRAFGLPQGLRACWSTPIVGINGALLGTFAMYYRAPKAPEPHHLQLIETITHTAAIAIERAQTEAALRHNEASLEAAQAQAGLGSWEVDAGTQRPRWSRQMYRLFNRDSTLGPPTFAEFLELVHPADRALIVASHERIKAGSGPLEIEFRRNPARGSMRHFVARIDYVRDGVEPPRTIAGTLLDITERKRAEEERLRLAAQLRQAQKMEALGTLAGGIAHDFNNVLAAIAGNAQLALADSPLGSPLRTSVTEIERAAARAGKLVRQILAFSRRDEAERRPLALAPVVEEALKLLRATVPAMIEIRADLAADLPEVSADATQIHQILINLGGNAAHAIGDRRGVLEVRLAAVAITAEEAPVGELHPGRYVHLSVSDTGCGMDEATLERIFDPFFTTKAPGQGTGLGLSVVHGIVQSYGGAITVESTLGTGTTFHLYFPEVAKAIGEVAALTAPTVTQGHGEHVLYVDDEEALVFLAERMLERLGYRVTAYEDAEQALQAFRAQPQDFDLVVTDLSMPRMSGRELARELLQIRPDVSIILMSGYVRQEDIDTAKRLGIREVVLKPNTVGELSEVLVRLLRAPAQD